MGRAEPLIRQWNLLKTLQSHRYGVCTDELAQRLECSTRQVSRDLGVLRDVGFPLEFEQRDFGKRFWKLSPRFLESDRLVLSMTEVLSLLLSRQLLLPLAGTVFGDGLGSALEKVKALLPGRALGYFENLDRTLLVKNLTRPDYRGKDREIRLLNQGIVDGQVLRIHYHSASQASVIQSEFHPYGLVFFGTNLYCIGHMARYDEVRTLKVSRFEQVAPTGLLFERPEDFSLSAYTQGSFGVFSPGRPRRIRVRFTGWAATNVREQQWHASQRIASNDPQALIAEFDLGSTAEFKRWVLGFGQHAAVLSPPDLVQEIRQELQGALEGYPPA